MYSNPLDPDPALYIAAGLPAVADLHARARLTRTGAGTRDNFVGFCYRVQLGAESFYRVRHDGTNWILEKVVAGAITSLATSATPAVAAGEGIRFFIDVVGSAHKVHIRNDDTGVASATLSATDSAIPGAGYFGLWGSGGGTSDGVAEPDQRPTQAMFFTESNSAGLMIEGGSNEAAITLPLAIVQGVGSTTGVAVSSGDGSVILPLAEVTGVLVHQQSGSGEFPMLAARIVARNGYGGALAAQFPRLEAQLTGGFPKSVITLPLIEVAGTMIMGGFGAAAITLPLATVTGALVQTNVARGDILLPLAIVEGVLLNAGAGVAAVTLPLAIVTGAGFTGLRIDAAITLPLIEVAGAGYGRYQGVVHGTLPALVGYLQSVSEDSTVQRIVSLNLRTLALTEYTGWAFNSIAVWKGRVLAASSAGLHELTGNDDAGTPIDASMRAGATDFSPVDEKGVMAPFVKYPTDAYLAYEADTEMVFSVFVGDDQYDYEVPRGRYVTPKGRSATIRPHKCALGRGIRSNYMGFGMRNKEGGHFKLDTMRVLAEVIKDRRV